MTNKERLISLLGFEPSQNALDGALIDGGVLAGEVYTAAKSVVLKQVAIQLMYLILTMADTEGESNGYVIKYDRNAVLKRIKMLEGEVGIVDASTPTITSRRVW